MSTKIIFSLNFIKDEQNNFSVIRWSRTCLWLQGKTQIIRLAYLVVKEYVYVDLNGRTFVLEEKSSPSFRDEEGEENMFSPIPGIVLRVLIKIGEHVQKGDPLFILEAMKMEHCINSTKNGLVKSILIKKGMFVDAGKNLIIIEALE